MALLAELQYLPEHEVPAGSALFRIQRWRSRRGTLAIGPLRLAPPGTFGGRFDLPDEPVGYFAESPETAAYECLVRREAEVLHIDLLRARALLTLNCRVKVRVLDLRPHASSFPFLQSNRYSITQALALEVRDAGYTGITYRSAQQYGMDCLALWGRVLTALRHAAPRLRLALVGSVGVHRAVASAIKGGKVPFIV